MSVTAAWLRVDLRRRWRSLVVLALLVAVATATVLAAVAGARRGESVLRRLSVNALPATAVVLPNEPGFDWDRVRAMPEVESLTTFLLGAMEIPIVDDATGETLSNDGVAFPPGDDAWGRTIERPVLQEGRLFDPGRADEIVASPGFMRYLHKRLGDTLTARLFTPRQVGEQASLATDAPDPAGPQVKLRIVGVGLSPWGHDSPGQDRGLMFSPGFAAQYRADFFNDHVGYANALVRLRGGAAALPAFQEHLAQLTGRRDIDVWDRAAQQEQEQRNITFENRCLLAFAGAALIAALFLVGQAVARYTASTLVDLQVLRALGMTPRQAAQAAVASPVVAAVVGTTAGVAVAAVASRWFPIGAAGLTEPSPGTDLDGLVLGAGWVAVPLLVLAGSAAAAWSALRWERVSASGRRSGVAALAASAGLPVPMVVGTRFALESGRGRTAVPVRPALVGAVAGVLGVIGVFTFADGVSDVAGNPARFGQTWQLGAFLGYNDSDAVADERSLLAAVARDRDVAGVNDTRLAVAHAGGHDRAVTLFSYDLVGTPIRVVLTDGRLPMSDTDVVLAPTAARALNAEVGSRVRFTGPAGARELSVVGIGFVPTSPHNDYADGGWLTSGGYRALFGDKLKFHFALIAVRPGAGPAAVAQQLAALPGSQQAMFFWWADEFPTPVAQLRDVQVLPVALGVFLLLLALGAVGHALATAVRRRRVDVAVLRALGMTRWQSRGLVVTQASVLAIAGLLIGVPLGVALGRTIWRTVADYTPVEYVPPLALVALLLVGPLALVMANLLAAWPGHQAARLRISQVLRAE
ncbi:MAG: FtsX-like permease family protein [Kineosporiaceae bacterium]